MKASAIFFPTLREMPKEAELISHQLLLRGGFIRRVAAGIYTFLPLGKRVLDKVERICNEEMDWAGGQELLMPMVLPRELWERSGRWETFGPELLKFQDRGGRDHCLGPTHEEIVTALVAAEVRSYKQLPLLLYQSQTKFRDEPRPRGGLIRAREFLMNDLYSFHATWESLEETYDRMYQAYSSTFQRCGLEIIVVEAEAGNIGGTDTREFMVLCDTGEDVLLQCAECGYAANAEMAERRGQTGMSAPPGARADRNVCPPGGEPLTRVDTPDQKTVEEVCTFLGVTPDKLIKTLVCVADGKPVLALVRGDHDLNEGKLRRLLGVWSLRLADGGTIEEVTGAPVGFAGPVGLFSVPTVADYDVASVADGVTGANEGDAHFVGVNPGRDFDPERYGDIRYAANGDGCPRCQGTLRARRCIEVGHIFKLGTRYSEAIGANFLDDQGQEKPIIMGTYGIGVSRILPAVVETGRDEAGIIWPSSIAPFDAVVILLNPTQASHAEAAEAVTGALESEGFDVLVDEREESPGVKFKDADLIGIPVQVVIGRTFEKEGKFEVRRRGSPERHMVSLEQLAAIARQLLAE